MQTVIYRLKKYTASAISLFIALIAVIYSASTILNFFSDAIPKKPDLPIEIKGQSEQIEELRSLIHSLQLEVLVIEKVQSSIDTLNKLPANIPITKELTKLSQSFTVLETRFSRIEKVILDDPSKALETIILRKDLQNLRESNQTDLTSVRSEIDRVYDLNKWLVGLMFTMAIGILSLAISNFFRQKKEE